MAAMTVWDELKPVIATLLDQQPGADAVPGLGGEDGLGDDGMHDVLDTCFSRIDTGVNRHTSTAFRRDVEHRSINITVNVWLSCRRHDLQCFFTSFSSLCSGDIHNPCWWDRDLFYRPIGV